MMRRSKATSRISAVARPGRSSERGIRQTPRPRQDGRASATFLVGGAQHGARTHAFVGGRCAGRSSCGAMSQRPRRQRSATASPCPPRSRGRRRSGAAPRSTSASPRRRAGSRPARCAADACDGSTAIRRGPAARLPPWRGRAAADAGRRRRPLRRPRSNRRPPISSSRRATPADSVGWVTWQRSAAAVKLPVSATARK